MKCLVMLTIEGKEDVPRVDSLLANAAAVCAGGSGATPSQLGTFTRQGRKSDETVRAAVIEFPGAGEYIMAKRLESVLRAMLAAAGLEGFEVRAWDGDEEGPA